MPGTVVQAFAKEIACRDVRRLETYLAEHVAARFDIAGDLIGRTALLGFWGRLFQSYSLFELHILKCVAEDDLVIADSAYLLAARCGGLLDVRAISVFEVQQGVITHWRDHADLAEVPVSEKDRWLRLSRARW
ncbi:nuclear transport factor 2 family protein [Brevundimonas intermedia]|uniref:Nuclear transport factor 2 family protein n=2 Tax=Brevundimonas intermedia TaxID=74315 RepID=A0A4Y9RQ83_9CAUL|nr:nuclear transport factor 2 family protein [Brevundimonas intermedia]